MPEPACCETSVAPGCDDPAIEACVCDLRLTCCSESWDLECTGLAIIACELACGDASDDGTGGADASDEGGSDDLSEDDGSDGGPASTGGSSDPDPMPDPSDDGPMMGPSCGEVADLGGWQDALCEWNGNNACGGQGTPTWDCDFCCEVSW